MTTTLRTNASHQDFIALVKLLDADLAERDGEDHAFYHQFNSVTQLQHAIVMYHKNKAVGCGALKQFDDNSMEVKRMYILPEARGKRYATQILNELESWASELNFKYCVLETGKRQPEAIALYKKNGYQIIPNYGQYHGIENSICFQKTVSS